MEPPGAKVIVASPPGITDTCAGSSSGSFRGSIGRTHIWNMCIVCFVALMLFLYPQMYMRCSCGWNRFIVTFLDGLGKKQSKVCFEAIKINGHRFRAKTKRQLYRTVRKRIVEGTCLVCKLRPGGTSDKRVNHKSLPFKASFVYQVMPIVLIFFTGSAGSIMVTTVSQRHRVPHRHRRVQQPPFHELKSMIIRLRGIFRLTYSLATAMICD